MGDNGSAPNVELALRAVSVLNMKPKRNVKQPDYFANDTAVYSVFANYKRGNWKEYVARSFADKRISVAELTEMTNWFDKQPDKSTASLQELLARKQKEGKKSEQWLREELVFIHNATKGGRTRSLAAPVQPSKNYKEPGDWKPSADDYLPAAKSGKRLEAIDEDGDELEDEDQDDTEDDAGDDADNQFEGDDDDDHDVEYVSDDQDNDMESDDVTVDHKSSKKRRSNALTSSGKKARKLALHEIVHSVVMAFAHGDALLVFSLGNKDTMVVRVRTREQSAGKKLPQKSVSLYTICTRLLNTEQAAFVLSICESSDFWKFAQDMQPMIAELIPASDKAGKDEIPLSVYQNLICPYYATRATEIYPGNGPILDVIRVISTADNLKEYMKNHGTPRINVDEQLDEIEKIKAPTTSAAVQDFMQKYASMGQTEEGRRSREMQLGVLLAMKRISVEQAKELRKERIAQLPDPVPAAAPIPEEGEEEEEAPSHETVQEVLSALKIKQDDFTLKRLIAAVIKDLEQHKKLEKTFPGKQAEFLQFPKTVQYAIEHGRLPALYMDDHCNGDVDTYNDHKDIYAKAFVSLKEAINRYVLKTVGDNTSTSLTADEYLIQLILEVLTYEDQEITVEEAVEMITENYDFNTANFEHLKDEVLQGKLAVLLFELTHAIGETSILRLLPGQAYTQAAESLTTLLRGKAGKHIRAELKPLKIKRVVQNMLWYAAKISLNPDADKLGLELEKGNWYENKLLVVKTIVIEDDDTLAAKKGCRRFKRTELKGHDPVPAPSSSKTDSPVKGSRALSKRQLNKLEIQFVQPLIKDALVQYLQDNGVRLPVNGDKELDEVLRVQLAHRDTKILRSRQHKLVEGQDTLETLKLSFGEANREYYLHFRNSKPKPEHEMKAFLIQVAAKFFSRFNIDMPDCLTLRTFKQMFPLPRD